MGKKRTGLQGSIASIFSGVPIPKKGQPGPEPPAPAGKGDASGGNKPPAVPPRAAPPSSVPAVSRPVAQPVPEIAPRVIPAAAPERKVTAVPRRKKAAVSGAGAGISPTRQRVSIAMIVILSVLLFVLLGKPFGKSPPGPAAPGAVAGPAMAAAAPKAGVKIDWPIPELYPVKGHDPMAALGKQEVIVPQTPESLVVKGITYSDEKRFAIIGIQTVQEGDTVEGTEIKVTRISRDSVEFVDGTGKTWTQKVQGENNTNR